MPQTLGARYLLAQGLGVVYEPVRKHSWEVTIAAVGVSATEIALTAQSVDPPKYSHEAKALWHMNERVQYAGRGTVGDINIKLMDVINPHVVRSLYNWWSQIYNVDAAAGNALGGPVMGFATNYKSTLTIRQYDIAGGDVRTWTCYGIWAKNSPAPDMLDYNGDEALMVNMVLACDRFQMTPNI